MTWEWVTLILGVLYAFMLMYFIESLRRKWGIHE